MVRCWLQANAAVSLNKRNMGLFCFAHLSQIKYSKSTK